MDNQSDSIEERTRSMHAATADAAKRMLELADTASESPITADRAAELARYSELCNEAADHVAKAHESLFADDDQAEAAIAHLDAAIDCLKQLPDRLMPAAPVPDYPEAQSA